MAVNININTNKQRELEIVTSVYSILDSSNLCAILLFAPRAVLLLITKAMFVKFSFSTILIHSIDKARDKARVCHVDLDLVYIYNTIPVQKSSFDLKRKSSKIIIK